MNGGIVRADDRRNSSSAETFAAEVSDEFLALFPTEAHGLSVGRWRLLMAGSRRDRLAHRGRGIGGTHRTAVRDRRSIVASNRCADHFRP